MAVVVVDFHAEGFCALGYFLVFCQMILCQVMFAEGSLLFLSRPFLGFRGPCLWGRDRQLVRRAIFLFLCSEDLCEKGRRRGTGSEGVVWCCYLAESADHEVDCEVCYRTFIAMGCIRHLNS